MEEVSYVTKYVTNFFCTAVFCVFPCSPYLPILTFTVIKSVLVVLELFLHSFPHRIRTCNQRVNLLAVILAYFLGFLVELFYSCLERLYLGCIFVPGFQQFLHFIMSILELLVFDGSLD